MDTERKFVRLVAAAILMCVLLAPRSEAASVTGAGYTNAFTGAAPSSADFTTLALGSSAATIVDPTGLDNAVQAVNASSIATAISQGVNDPPDIAAPATWAASGYLQTRPTSVDATLMMLKLVNNIGTDASSVTIAYDFSKAAVVTESEVDGVRAYYSLSGNAGTWQPIPNFSTANAGRLSATINAVWPASGTLYIVWGDDNANGVSDTAFQFDNFYVTAVAASHVPASITADPQSQVVAELSPVSFSATVIGYPAPTLQWYKDGNIIPNATNASYSITSAPANFNGAVFKLVAQNVASNVAYSVTSSPAILTVNADTVAPTLVQALAAGLNQVIASFSERVTAATATNIANYLVTNSGGALTISNILLDATQTNITMTVTTMTPGSSYTLVVNGVRDLSAAANPVPANSTFTFAAAAAALADVGSPSTPGFVTAAGNGYNVSGVGTNIGNAADQFTLVYQQLAGDFDVKIRMPAFTSSSPWAKAGLMARENLTPGARFAATLATPNVGGINFYNRNAVSAVATTSGTFPVNFPYTWLRLSRVGDLFTGYASFDGQQWVSLGSVVIAMGPSVYFGMAASSDSPSVASSVQFRDQQSAAGGIVIPSPVFTREPLSASSRRTGLVISEIMYHPKPRQDGKRLEFVEIYNSMSIFEDISGYRVTGDVNFTFPNGTIIQPGQFIVLAKVAADVQSVYGISGVFQYGTTNYATNIVGNQTNVTVVLETNVVDGVTNVRPEISNSLQNNGGTLRLRTKYDAVLLEVTFGTQSPWPEAPDGSGHSLVLARPSYGEGNPKAWDASDVIGGSPGTYDSIASEPARNVVINEFLAHTDPPQMDTIELHNHGTTSVDLSGFWLSDDLGENKFRIPDGTVLGPRGFVAFTCEVGNPVANITNFSLTGSGEVIVLVNSNLTRVIDVVKYDGQENGVSMGRYPDGAPTFRRLAGFTPGTTNSPVRFDPIVINEIMYAPISGNGNDEFVELYNRGSNAVNVGNWRFVNGIDFTFPENTVMGPGDYLVVARNAARLRTNYSSLNVTNCLGNFSGSLANSGERLSLAAPDYEVRTNNSVVTTNVSFRYIVNELTYGSGGKWPYWADGGGSSMELLDSRSDNSLPSSWADSDDTGKSVWTSFEWTGPVDNPLNPPSGISGDSLYVMTLGVGECLVDELEVRTNNATSINLLANGSFENNMTAWAPQGSHDQSFIDNAGFIGKALHIRAGSRGDNGQNRIRSQAFTPITTGNATIRGKARWVRGFPEILLRFRGGTLEAFCRMPVPSNLGTPGARNSRAITNSGPAIFDVVHTPGLPQANEAVRVTARVTDPDGVTQLVLRYRVSTAPTTFVSVPMADNGSGGDAVAGDGLFTATINGQNSGTLIGFHISATDALGATNLFPASALSYAFPSDSPTHEAIIRWGDTQMPGSFASYHLWITDWAGDGTRQRWEARDKLNNAGLDGTFVYNNYRVIYNVKPQYGGSPWHVGSMNGPLNTGSRVDFVMNAPEDDELLGQTDFIFNTVGNPSGNTSSDTSGLAEQSSYEVFKGMGLVYNYRRYIHFFVNGQQRSITGNLPGNFIMEDSQQPNGDMINEWFADDSEGQLYKIEDWFEFPDDGGQTGSHTNDDADMQRRNTTIGGTNVIKLAPYRFMWRKRSISAGDSANDYTNFLALVDIVSPATNGAVSPLPDYIVKQLDLVMDFEQWYRIFSVQHAVGNWDTYGYRRGKNAYTYRPERGKFVQMTWDIDFTMGVGGDGTGQTLFDTTDQRLGAMNDTPETVRAYWRALQDLVNGPFSNGYLDPRIDARSAAFRANNVSYDPATVATVKSYITGRRNYIISQIPTTAFSVASTAFTSSSNIVTITGTAPIDVKFITINGIRYPLSWTGTRTAPFNWSLRLPLGVAGTANYSLQAYDRNTNAIAGTSRTLTINYTGVIESAETNIVINELMINSSVAGAEYIELFNRSTGFTFDLSGWRINGLDYTFPQGSYIGPRTFLVLTKDRVQFANVYGGGVQVFDQFNGDFQNGGETITLLRPGPNGTEIVVDKVRYDNLLPWPQGVDGTGSSLQVVDSAQDNSRVGNWTARYNPPVYSQAISTPAQTNDGWRFVVRTGNFGSSDKLIIYPDNPGTLWLDDFSLVQGTNAAVGTNLVRGGDFEDPAIFANPAIWGLGTNLNTSYITNDAARPGGGPNSLRMVAPFGGSASLTNRDIVHIVSPTLPNATPITISFWYFATNTSIQTLTVRLLGGPLITTNISIFIIPSNYVPPQLVTASTNFATPGTTNTGTTNLAAFQPIWINEVQADNTVGITDNFGQREPWIEIYNASTNPVSLDGLYLSTTYTNLTNYALPAGITLAPREFRLIWCDGQPEQDSGTNIHTSFRLPSTSGSIAISRVTNGTPQVLDYVNYSGIHQNRSYGSYPDGQPFDRQEFFYVTARGTNNPASAPLNVFINEWMASNTNFLADPTGGAFDDWFEIYNPSATAVDLAGYYLTDSLTNAAGVVTNKIQFLITTNMAHIIPPFGHLLVFADNQENQNVSGTGAIRPDLHVNFALAKGGEAIGLFAADGTQIDYVTFGPQLDNHSQGRCPDGSANIVTYGPTVANMPTPRSANVGCGGANSPPLLDPVSPITIFLGETAYFTAQAVDAESPPQTLTFSLDAGAPPNATIGGTSGFFSWTPGAIGTNTIVVRVTDNGTPPMSDSKAVTIRVQTQPGFSTASRSGTDLTLTWPTVPGRSYQIVYKDDIDEPGPWHALGQPLQASESQNTLSITYDTTNPPHRFYKLVTLP